MKRFDTTDPVTGAPGGSEVRASFSSVSQQTWWWVRFPVPPGTD